MDDRRAARGAGRVLSLVLIVLGCSACASSAYEPRDWSGYEGPGAAYFQAEEVEFPHADDPLERVNRVSAKVNYEFLRQVVAPAAFLYGLFVPEPAREHLARAGINLRFPVRFVNNLLQGKFERGGVEASRFALNTTAGVLGLFDPAQHWGLHPYPEDFGQTLATWGWKPSTYLFLPVIGPSTTRDALGELVDAVLDPAFYFFPATYAQRFNETSLTLEADLRTVQATYDAYEAARTLYTLQTEVDVEDFRWQQDESGPTQTLGVIFLVPRDTDFGGRARTERVSIDAARPQLPYSLWLQPEPAPVMYVLPGFGGHRLGASTLALAEIAYEQGHTVVAISSPTNWEFMGAGASVTVPGYGPVDAHDVHVALSAIDRQLAARLPGRLLERRIAGMSIGAYQALRIAAERNRGAGDPGRAELMEFDLYLALNPPVDIEHALRQLDRFYNAPLEFPPEERAHRIEEIFAKVIQLADGDLTPGVELPFTEIESRFLIGLAFRLDLQFLILCSQELFDSGVLRTPRSRLRRAPAFREASEYSYMEYFYAFVLPYFARRLGDVDFDEAGARRLFERSSLQALEGELAAAPAVRVFTNQNDFLLRPEDLVWLREVLGERLTLSEQGGHLGNLYREYIQRAIAAAMIPDNAGAQAP